MRLLLTVQIARAIFAMLPRVLADVGSQLHELWAVARKVLSTARQVRAVFHREDVDYLRMSGRAKVVGRALVSKLKSRVKDH